jgi:DNA-binding transcriptional ArsR family regulator
MVQYQERLDGIFAALADPTRRAMLERLREGDATITELATPFDISLTGAKKHVAVLERAALLSSEKVGRARRCSLEPRTLDDVERWIESYRGALEARLDRLEAFLQDDTNGDDR